VGGVIDGREVALANLTVIDAPPPTVVDCAAAAGFDGVTLRIRGDLLGDTPVRRETIAQLATSHLGVLDAEVIRLRAGTDVAALEPFLDSAAALGARHVLVTGEDPDEARLAQRLGELCARAAPLGLRPVLEFMVFTAVKTVEQADRIAAVAGSGVLVDPLHLSRSGGVPADVAKLAAANPERYPYAQLCDAPAATPGDLYEEAVNDRLAPGDGELPLRDLLAALPANAPLSVETPVAALAGAPPAERARHALEATRRLVRIVDRGGRG
jgi:sugar phosphate isomerase/epimerase